MRKGKLQILFLGILSMSSCALVLASDANDDQISENGKNAVLHEYFSPILFEAAKSFELGQPKKTLQEIQKISSSNSAIAAERMYLEALCLQSLGKYSLSVKKYIHARKLSLDNQLKEKALLGQRFASKKLPISKDQISFFRKSIDDMQAKKILDFRTTKTSVNPQNVDLEPSFRPFTMTTDKARLFNRIPKIAN